MCPTALPSSMGEGFLSLYALQINLFSEILASQQAGRIGPAVLAVAEYIDVFFRLHSGIVHIRTGWRRVIRQLMAGNQGNNIEESAQTAGETSPLLLTPHQHCRSLLPNAASAEFRGRRTSCLS